MTLNDLVQQYGQDGMPIWKVRSLTDKIKKGDLEQNDMAVAQALLQFKSEKEQKEFYNIIGNVIPKTFKNISDLSKKVVKILKGVKANTVEGNLKAVQGLDLILNRIDGFGRRSGDFIRKFEDLTLDHFNLTLYTSIFANQAQALADELNEYPLRESTEDVDVNVVKGVKGVFSNILLSGEFNVRSNSKKLTEARVKKVINITLEDANKTFRDTLANIEYALKESIKFYNSLGELADKISGMNVKEIDTFRRSMNFDCLGYIRDVLLNYENVLLGTKNGDVGPKTNPHAYSAYLELEDYKDKKYVDYQHTTHGL